MRTRLADPDYEPTDEELAGLMRAAFADVPERRRLSLIKLYGRWSTSNASQLARIALVPMTTPRKMRTLGYWPVYACIEIGDSCDSDNPCCDGLTCFSEDEFTYTCSALG